MCFASNITYTKLSWYYLLCSYICTSAYDLRMDYSHTFVILYFIKNKIYAEYGKLKNKCLACHCMSTFSWTYHLYYTEKLYFVVIICKHLLVTLWQADTFWQAIFAIWPHLDFLTFENVVIPWQVNRLW